MKFMDFMPRMVSSFAFLFFFCFSILGCQESPSGISTELGEIQGVESENSSVTAYLGIPFAKAPVGEKRWTAPETIESWNGTLVADSMPAGCIQLLQGSRLPWSEEFMHQGEISEDCLYLNIWTASDNSGDKRPVMVYLYGGAFNEGSNSVAVYNGEELAKKGVIQVGVNYRVGPLGFMAHPELTTESPNNASGNYGLLDQVAALEWVQDNIAAFGGDPDNVTIFGQSAGGMSVALLLESPLAQGLFHRAIIQSGPGLFPMRVHGDLTPLAMAEELGSGLADTLGVLSLSELRAIDADKFAAGGLGRFGPVADGYFLPLNNGHLNRVPVMNGFTADESQLFGGFGPTQDFSMGTFIKDARANFEMEANTFFRLYQAESEAEVVGVHKDGGRDRGRVAVNSWAKDWQDIGASVYTYYFERAMPWPEHPEYGAFHTSDVPYVFNNLKFMDRPLESIDHQVADAVSSYWVNFAKNGDPNWEGLAHWPAYTDSSDQIMSLGANMGPIPLAEPDAISIWRAVVDP